MSYNGGVGINVVNTYEQESRAVAGSTNWKPGQSGNPAGRPPKNKALTELLRKKMRTFTKVAVADPDGIHRGKVKVVMVGQALVDTMTQLALLGDRELLKYVFDRLDGKPTVIAEIESTNRISGEEAREMLKRKLEDMAKKQEAKDNAS